MSDPHQDADNLEAMVPALVIGGAALAVACGLALLIASRVTRPLGQLREQVRRIAEGDFRTLLKADPDVKAALSDAEIDEKFDLEYHLKHVDTIFARVFGAA